MRKLLFILFVLAGLYGSAQGPIPYTSTRYLGLPKERGYFQGFMQADSAIANALRDTTFTPWRLGIQIFRTADVSLYVSVAFTGQKWQKVGGGSGTVNSGTANSLAYYPSTGTTLDDAAGLTWDNTTKIFTVGGSTFGGRLFFEGDGTDGQGIHFNELGSLMAYVAYDASVNDLAIGGSNVTLGLFSNLTTITVPAFGVYATSITDNINIGLEEQTIFKLGILGVSSKVVTMPTASSNTGRIIEIWNTNTSGTYSWTTAAAYTKPDGTTSSTLTNGKYYQFRSDGTNWIRILESDAAGGGGLSGLTAGRVTFATSATTIGDDAEFLYNSTDNELIVGGSTDNGAYKLQSNGNSFFAGNMEIRNNANTEVLIQPTANGIYQARIKLGANSNVSTSSHFEVRHTYDGANYRNELIAGNGQDLNIGNIGMNDALTILGSNNTVRVKTLDTDGTAPSISGTTRLVTADGNGTLSFSEQLTLNTQFTPSTSTDATHANKTLTADDTYLWYRTSTGTWKKIAWTAFYIFTLFGFRRKDLKQRRE